MNQKGVTIFEALIMTLGLAFFVYAVPKLNARTKENLKKGYQHLEAQQTAMIKGLK